MMFSASDKYAETYNQKNESSLTAQIAHERSVCLLHAPHQLHQAPPVRPDDALIHLFPSEPCDVALLNAKHPTH